MDMSNKIRFGVIGAGFMGKEFAGVAGRWYHLSEDIPAPEIVAVCATRESSLEWFTKRVPTVKYTYTDYREMLKNPEIDAVYCAVPHLLHKQMYVDIIESGKHLMGEKPFGIDKEANDAILEACARHPEVIVRCASEFPFFPGCQRLVQWIEEGRLGRILEVHAGLNHSSDLNPNKPINWKRTLAANGEYGCMGDLGLHVQHVPIRMGWIPEDVCAKLYSYITERPDGKGGMAPCETWDNATLLCSARDKDGNEFPITYEMKRMKPGSANDWYLEVYGMDASVKFSTNDPNAFYFTQSMGNEQAWCRIAGAKPQAPTATPTIFEFGFTDAMLQMWASFLKEISGMEVSFGCFRPEETAVSHRLLTAALESQKNKTVVSL